MRSVCGRCGSVNVKRDAWAEQNANGEWVLGAVFDAAYCDNCDGETWLIGEGVCTGITVKKET